MNPIAPPNHIRAAKLIELAASVVNTPASMASSAALCLEDAASLLEAGRIEPAMYRALKSISYSVGVLSPVYKEASKILDSQK